MLNDLLRIFGWNRIFALLIKEWIVLFRDPKMSGIVLVVPLIQVLLLGYAVTTDVEHIPTALYDEDLSQTSRNLTDAFTRSGYFKIVSIINNDKELAQSLDPPSRLVTLHIPPGFENDLKKGTAPAIQILLDGSEANTAKIAAGYSKKIVEDYIHKHFSNAAKPAFELKPRAWFNPNLESRNFFIPGLTATVISLLTLTLTSMAIVREKEIGTIEQMLVSPIKKWEFLVGKTLPFIIIGLLDAILVIAIAVYFFEVPFRGNLMLLLFGVCLYLLTTLGSGLFISTISKTQQQALLGAFLFYFPLVLLSGFLFPVVNMPLAIRFFAYMNPLYYFLIIIRAIFLKGIGIQVLWMQFLCLAGIGLIIFSGAIARFKKQMQ